MDDYQRSICYLEPYQGESISHYLGRWMNQEVVSISSSSSLSQQLRLGKTLWRWERFYFNPPPSEDELEILGNILELSQVQLRELFPPVEEPIKCQPIRLCGLCYAEKPYHRMEWQYQSQFNCSKHGVKLLTKCPSCRQRFAIPSHWVEGRCQRCDMAFKRMGKER